MLETEIIVKLSEYYIDRETICRRNGMNVHLNQTTRLEKMISLKKDK